MADNRDEFSRLDAERHVLGRRAEALKVNFGDFVEVDHEIRKQRVLLYPSEAREARTVLA